jgi:N-acetyl sugar amidotransferase
MSSGKTARPYQICTRCIMDTSDPGIEFDAQGICNRCRHCEFMFAARLPSPQEREQLLQDLVAQIKHEGRNKEYDCIIGVSGGVDSTYVAYVVKKQLGLRPLAVHLDNGWDSELAVANIEKCLKTLDIDLYTYVMDWDEFRELQLAFLRASTPDSEAPTDHAINSILKWKANQIGTRWLLMGNNLATENIRVTTWSMGQLDWRYIRSINRLFGKGPLKSFPHCSIWQDAWLRWVKRQRMVDVLDYVDYNKEQALQTLSRELGYVRYSGKHHESVYTRFYQSYILPRKFGYDKRRIHLSGLIMSGQMSREQALQDMTREIESAEQLRQDKIFVLKKFGLTEQEFDAIMALPPKSFWDYPSNEKLLAMRIRRAIVNYMHQRKAQQARQTWAVAAVPAPAPVAASAPAPDAVIS